MTARYDLGGSGDRRVHARSADGRVEIARYDRAGSWYRETTTGSLIPVRRLSVAQAVEEAVAITADGGNVFLGLPGGRVFDARYRLAEACSPPPP